MHVFPLTLFAVVLVAISSESLAEMPESGNDKPNILFVMSDDHTSQAIGVYGGRLAHLNPTPSLDAIAREGVVMDSAFCQNAICSPSRANIMTGQSSAVNGCPVLDSPLPKSRQYLAIEMGRAGYQTAVIGKWHLRARPAAFDYYRVLPGQGDYFNPRFYDSEQSGQADKTSGADEVSKSSGHEDDSLAGTIRMKGHSTDCITDSALDWLSEKRDKEKPFFLKLHYKAPHGQWDYAPRYESYLADVAIPEPANMRDRGNHGSIANRGHGDELVPFIGTSIGRRNPRRNLVKPRSGWRRELDQTRSDEEIIGDTYQGYMKAYLRCVKGVDDNLQRVVKYLKAEGLYDNTVIIYTGDQGLFLGEHDYMDKRWPYEEAMRMPLIIRYPKSVKVGRCDAIVENIDFAPTMLDWAGVPTPSYMHGHSFRSILETGQEPADWKQYAYYHYWMHLVHHDNPACIAVRSKRFKLIQYYGTPIKGRKPNTPPGWELYDLQSDPTEDNNVYDDPKYADVIAEHKQQLKRLRSELGEDDPKFPFNQVIEDFWDYDSEDRTRAIEISHAFAQSRMNGAKSKRKDKNKNKGKTKK